MSFANFVFYPLVVGTIVAVIIEQILRQVGNAYDPSAVKKVEIAMRVRKKRTKKQLKASRDESYGKFGSKARKKGKINR